MTLAMTLKKIDHDVLRKIIILEHTTYIHFRAILSFYVGFSKLYPLQDSHIDGNASYKECYLAAIAGDCYPGTLSLSQVFANHLKFGPWVPDLEMSYSDLI